MSDLDRFEIFTVIAETESLTRAAQLLGVSKPALSRQLKRLEEELNIDLFTRENLRLHLTETGRLLLAQCQRLKKELEETRAICAGLHDEPQGVLRIVALEFFARKLIYPKLEKFMARYPRLKIYIDSSERVPNFEKDKVDIAVGFTLPMPDEIVQKKMQNIRYVMAASPKYFDQYGRPENLKDLLQHQYIGHKVRDEVRAMNLKSPNKIKLEPNIILNNVEAMIECARNNLGIVQLPCYLLEKYLLSGELIEVLTEYQASQLGVYAYYPRYRYTQPKVRKFLDFMLS